MYGESYWAGLFIGYRLCLQAAIQISKSLHYELCGTLRHRTLVFPHLISWHPLWGRLGQQLVTLQDHPVTSTAEQGVETRSSRSRSAPHLLYNAGCTLKVQLCPGIHCSSVLDPTRDTWNLGDWGWLFKDRGTSMVLLKQGKNRFVKCSPIFFKCPSTHGIPNQWIPGYVFTV